MGVLYYFATIVLVVFIMYLYKRYKFKKESENVCGYAKVSLSDVLYESVNNKSNEVYKKRLSSYDIKFYFE